MPLFFFDIDDGKVLSRDQEGTECADARAASLEAIAVLPDIARDVLPEGSRHALVATVRDHDDRAVFRATLSLVGEWLVDPPPA